MSHSRVPAKRPARAATSTATLPSPARRRAILALSAAVFAVPVLSAPAAASHRDGDGDDYRPGQTGGCDRSLDYEDDIEDEKERFCAGPEGAYYRYEEEGDEERYDWDGAGTLRRHTEEEADGDEVERWYDENGVLRYYRREDDDGDLYEVEYDENGTRRWAHREDGDDNEDTYWWYDEEGNVVDYRDDD